ncbi:hypothetical protein GE278_24120 (plasmid) [Enterobacteriaceae bacterium Kacie_13]|nr:hypothetical protein GE278_24120 [Enterobacteriaceae bacterium Kacie_13]
MAHKRTGENERTRHGRSRGDLSAGGVITGSSGGAAFAAASLPLRQDGSPKGRDSLLALFTTAVPEG